ncbi:ABC transporter ATP-binding protein [Amantichitinum ursilacus]|uniref:Glutathione import ATP-binding protein GsiA n=1 Tax=Amantichitinum ursilacus TaxID=857265 RepID=A0A0N0XJD5_9NEIS|nr:ABC transporter ATP-binding protein [Amantichitinum ursilacus]KPC53715.1 Glutathione import ATP-binding protein GsiA [Amantichitinum ursilacus]
MNQDTLLQVRNLKVSFRGEEGELTEALKGINFDIPRNRTVALVGESGSGKSVTSMAIMQLLPARNTVIDPASQVTFEGRDLLALEGAELRKMRGKDIAMIFQEPMSSLNPVFTVGDQIAETLMLHAGLGRRDAFKRAVALLTEVGLPDPEKRAKAYPHELSGGQQQRVMIAMAIACEPKLLIADEPTTALDVTIQKQILQLLADLQKKHGMSVLFITHDLGLVGEFADDVVVMRHGEIREAGSVEQIFNAPANPYTKALLNCRPHLDSRPLRLAVIDDFMQPGGYVKPGERVRGYEASDEIILDVQHLAKSFDIRQGLFGKRQFHAVKDVSFQLPRGKTLGIVGESGSGKTTVGLTLVRLHQATGGKALFHGKDLLAMSAREFHEYKRRIQIIFQNPYASLNPRFTVEQILTEPMMLHGIGRVQMERVKMAQALLDRVGLPARSLSRYPHEFSGGQRQRIAIARCLTLKPEVLICDESVSALDVSVQAQVLNLLQELQDEYKLSYLFISHDLAVVKHISDQVLVMNKGEVVEQGDSDAIYRAPAAAYTRKLLDSIPTGWQPQAA